MPRGDLIGERRRRDRPFTTSAAVRGRVGDAPLLRGLPPNDDEKVRCMPSGLW